MMIAIFRFHIYKYGQVRDCGSAGGDQNIRFAAD